MKEKGRKGFGKIISWVDIKLRGLERQFETKQKK